MTTSLTLQIEGVEDLRLKKDLETACNDVLKIFETKVARVPPLGVKPIVIRPAPDNTPRFCLDERLLAGQYPINLTCLAAARYYNQLVYQFAHELCHVYMTPHDWNQVAQYSSKPHRPNEIIPWNNWFAESMCFTMSYLCLNEIAEKWRRLPPYPYLINYAPTFAQYRQNDISKYLGELMIPTEDKTAEWIQSELLTLVEKCTEENRAEQSACATVLERAFLKHPKSWGALCTLGDCIDNRNTDFDRWRELTTIKKQRELVKALAKMFDPKKDSRRI
jgi:hypothetical protein